MKKFYIQYGISKAKYLVNFHNGISKHNDGSEFFDIKIFKNKKLLNKFINNLTSEGYIERW
jgi:hypothetical protein